MAVPVISAPAPGGLGEAGARAGKWWVWALCCTALAVTVVVALWMERASPKAEAFWTSLHGVSLLQLALGILAINGGLVIRAYRWALLMPRENRPSAGTLIAPQFAGFAAVSLFGRVADLTRPYLVAKRVGAPVATQVAIYSVERAFDLLATAVLFSVTLLFVPRTAPHHQAFSRAGMLAGLAAAFVIGFGLVLRSAGERLATFAETRLGRWTPGLGRGLGLRLREMQAGFVTLRSPGQLLGAFAWSMVIWFGIALSYLFVAHSLTGVPQLTELGLPSILLLMATSMGASLLQLPVVGWFTQIAALAAAYHGFFGVPPAAASLCGTLTFVVNTLSVIPFGLVLAKTSGLSLREAQRASAAVESKTAARGEAG